MFDEKYLIEQELKTKQDLFQIYYTIQQQLRKKLGSLRMKRSIEMTSKDLIEFANLSLRIRSVELYLYKLSTSLNSIHKKN